MTLKPVRELLNNIKYHEIPGIRILGLFDETRNRIKHNLMSKISPNTSNKLTVLWLGGIDVTLYGFSGDGSDGE